MHSYTYIRQNRFQYKSFKKDTKFTRKKQTQSKVGERYRTDTFQKKTFMRPGNMKKGSSSLVTREMHIKSH